MFHFLINLFQGLVFLATKRRKDLLFTLLLLRTYTAGMETGSVPNLGRTGDYRCECCLGPYTAV